ncbi:MAG: hypothetical protein OEV67_14115 [Betaproteobacteria bacterium]|nr:hypothetical protein [Betaproteobacteria bacterium]
MLVAFDQHSADFGLDHLEYDLTPIEFLLGQRNLYARVTAGLVQFLQLLERALHITEILALSGVRRGQAVNILLWQQGVAIDVITADFEFQLVASSRRCGIRDLRNQNGRKLALLLRRI